MKLSKLKLLYSPAALCLYAVCLIIGFSIAGPSASNTITFHQQTKFGFAKSSFPIRMRQWDEPLFNLLTARSKAEMAEFLKSAEQDAAAKPAGESSDWKPYSQSVHYIEQFRSLAVVSYLEVTTVKSGGQSAITFRAINFDNRSKRELGLGDLFEGVTDRSKPLEALADYARADIKDQSGEEEESEALLELTKADLGVYERFTFCPSTKIGMAAGLTIHFPPTNAGAYAGSDFHITIPYTVFAKFLKPGLKSMFSGEPRQAPVTLQDADT
jgi:hypothetical protein